MRNKGDRIGALLSADKANVQLLGYGVYLGDEIPTAQNGKLSEPMALGIALDKPVPKLQLDNGSIVYGCECWWAGEDQIKEQVDALVERGAKLTNVNLDEYRNMTAEEVAAFEKQIRELIPS